MVAMPLSAGGSEAEWLDERKGGGLVACLADREVDRGAGERRPCKGGAAWRQGGARDYAEAAAPRRSGMAG